MKKIGVLASYNGSGFEAILKAIKENSLNAQVVVIITNNSNAGVIQKANENNIPYFIINKNKFPDESIDEKITNTLINFECDYIFLSGYMKKIENNLLNKYKGKIINCHPALLPSKYGGKGMYGRFVHEAVIKNEEVKSGVTVHYVNENYDDGKIILKKEIYIEDNETVQSLENRIKQLEAETIVESFKILLEEEK